MSLKRNPRPDSDLRPPARSGGSARQAGPLWAVESLLRAGALPCPQVAGGGAKQEGGRTTQGRRLSFFTAQTFARMTPGATPGERDPRSSPSFSDSGPTRHAPKEARDDIATGGWAAGWRCAGAGAPAVGGSNLSGNAPANHSAARVYGGEGGGGGTLGGEILPTAQRAARRSNAAPSDLGAAHGRDGGEPAGR